MERTLLNKKLIIIGAGNQAKVLLDIKRNKNI